MKLKPGRPVCLVVDDLSIMLSLGLEMKALVDFVHYSQQMLCAHDGLCKVTVRATLEDSYSVHATV